ncbi:hypothetical protein K2D_42260 [Planctomycetes bacterium K2D]|uniref:Uncharacterized protein n=2 Tax=Botrimarina mediterranea TaxID=2528022 RepID=A0A518KDY6_9BACT|nr:hypothetical protein Spa11_42250 [Botrimarina mediterranea]QDV80596.1 hypothetical protein K2D_42260 [Planctomycetes bacterium K2D]
MKWRRLWRRRLKRRPLLPFLLAAFVAADIAVLRFAESSRSDFAELSLLAMLGAQLGLLAIWTTHSMRGWAPRVAISTGLLMTAVSLVEQPDEDQYIRAVIFPTFAVTALGVIFSRWIASSHQRRKVIAVRKRKFGIATVLWITLVVALLIAVLRNAGWSVLAYPLTLILAVVEAAPAVAMVAVDRWFPKGWKRFYGLLATPFVAVLATAAWAMTPRGGPAMIGQPRDFLPYYIVQASIIGLSLYLLTPRFRIDRSGLVIDGESPDRDETIGSIDLSA